MFWMTYPIDAVFIDKKGIVVGLSENVQPWRLSRMFFAAHSCLELPSGTISSTGTKVGDEIVSEETGDAA